MSQSDIQPHVLEWLRREGISTLEQWRRLGRRRLEIFGITRAMARQLDVLAARNARGGG